MSAVPPSAKKGVAAANRLRAALGSAYSALACRRRGLDARDTLILAFSHEGRRDPQAARGAWFWAAGLAVGGRGLDARDTLILAFSHKGRGDPLAALGAWFRFAYPR